MLTAHANTTADDFIAQLRTYVIAMGMSTQVVDCVDNLVGTDDVQEEAEHDGAEGMKEDILDAVREWARECLGEETTKDLLTVIRGVEV